MLGSRDIEVKGALNINILNLDLFVNTNTLYIVSLFEYNKSANRISNSNSISRFFFNPFNKGGFLLGLYNNYINIKINIFSVFNNFLKLITKNNTNNTNTITNPNLKVYIYNL